MANSKTTVVDKVCQLGQTCYCNPSFSDRLSRFFITISIVLLLTVIAIYIIYLNRNKIALTLAPKLYYDTHGNSPNSPNSSNNNSPNNNSSNIGSN